jgi:hypothetical protein
VLDEALHETVKSDNLWSSNDVMTLLVKLLSSIKTYILVYAIDECEKDAELLIGLKNLMRDVALSSDGQHCVHLMLCSRSDAFIINLYFGTGRTQLQGSRAVYHLEKLWRHGKPFSPSQKNERTRDELGFYSKTWQFTSIPWRV